MALAAQSSGLVSGADRSWPASAVLREHAPVVRLLSSIWAIPRVTKVGMTLGEASVDLWVFMDVDDPDAEAEVSVAERAYTNSTSHTGLTLHVIPDGAVSPDSLPAYEMLFER